MNVIHHSAICVRDVEASLRFWRDGLGFEQMMDHSFDGDWPTLLRGPSRTLRSVFLGDTANPHAGIVELVDMGDVVDGDDPPEAATTGFLLLSVFTDLGAALARLDALGLGGTPRRIAVSGVDMAVVVDPSGVLVEIIDSPDADAGAAANLDRMTKDV